MNLDHVAIVLSRPSEPRNIGSAARALKNCRISSLVVATDRTIDIEAARPLAVGAGDVLDSMRVVPSLEQATRDRALIAGVTRRTGKRRKAVSFSPWQLAARICSEQQPIAVVFGNEQSGLSDAELELCHMAVSIPSSPDFPSLNLSHAVQIVCYEIYITGLGWPRERRTVPDAVAAEPGFVRPSEINEAVNTIAAHLNKLGFLTQEGPQGMPALLAELVGRAMVSPGELQRLVAMFAKLEGMHRDR